MHPRDEELNRWAEGVSHIDHVVEAIQNGTDNVEPTRLHALADELQEVAERYDAYEPLDGRDADPLAELPPFPPLGAWHLCMFCNQEIGDRQLAVAITTRPEWHPDVYLHYSAHRDCLRRVVHPDIGTFSGSTGRKCVYNSDPDRDKSVAARM